MSFNPKVVPFDRGADFMHQRARKNQRENNLVEALELMRKAVAQSPDNDGYALDLAELLGDTGCRAASNRLFLDTLVRGGDKARCLYGLAVNVLGTNDPEGAKRILNMCADTSGQYRDQAMALSGEIDMYETLNRPASRKQERILNLSDEACEKMRIGDVESARKLFARVLEKDPGLRDVHAMMAMACMMSGDSEAAIAHAERAVIEPGTTLRALCISAQVYAMAGDEERMCGALSAARMMGAEGIDCYMLIFSLFEAGMYTEAREEALFVLRETPYDRLLMHVAALSTLKLGENKNDAMKYWQRIVRIDPDDTIAGYFLKAVREDTLNIDEATCEYQVPRDEMFTRFKQITDCLSMGFTDLVEKWHSDGHFRALVGWCLISEDIHFREISVAMLASFDDDNAESILREYLSRPDTGKELIFRAVSIYKMRGRDTGRILPLNNSADNGILPDGRQILSGMSVGHRQLVRIADDMLKKYYGISAYDQLSVIWDMYRHRTNPVSDPMNTTETAAAALAYCYLEFTGGKPGYTALSVQFDCSLRQLKYYVKHLTAVLERGGAPRGSAD